MIKELYLAFYPNMKFLHGIVRGGKMYLDDFPFDLFWAKDKRVLFCNIISLFISQLYSEIE